MATTHAMDVTMSTTTIPDVTGSVLPASAAAGGASVVRRRDSLNGVWVLDKTRGNWSMNRYLEVMNVDPLAIEAHEKGEKEYDTFHTITFYTDIQNRKSRVQIVKRSRVNNDLTVDLELGGVEHTEYLSPGNRPKICTATSDHTGHLRMQSSLHTVNGKASVTDVKTLHQELNGSVLVQELTILNDQTGIQHTTVRYFNPYDGPPPHEAVSGMLPTDL